MKNENVKNFEKMKNEQGERRERLPAQRGDASNSRVFTRLTGSGVMLMFLHDFVGVLSKPISSRATPVTKLKL